MRRQATIQYPRLFAPVLTTAQFPELVSEDRWNRPLSEPARNHALRNAWRGPAGSFAPVLTTAQFPEQVSEDRWNRPLSEPVRLKALPTAVVAASGSALVQAAPFPESVTADRWAQPLSQPKFEVGLRVASQPYISFVKAALFPESVTADRWFQPFSQPRFEYTLRAASQPYYAFVKAAPFEEAVSADRWFQPLATPIAPRRLPEYPSYSFSYFVAAATETITPDKWYRPLTEPTRAKLSISTGPFFVQAAPFAESVSADRWVQPFSSPQFRKLAPYTVEVRPPSLVVASPFVGADVVEADSGTIVWPPGTIAGDSAILLLFGNGSTSMTGTGWTQDINHEAIDGFTFYSAWHKTSLSAGEVTSPFSFIGTDFGGYIVYVCRGANGINFITHTTVGGATNTLAGFTKDANSFFIASLISDRNTSPLTVGVPAGFTERDPEATTFFTCDEADILPANYTNGANVVWSGLDSGQNSGAGLWEFLSGGETITLDKWFQPFGLPLRPRPIIATPTAFVQSAPFTEAVSADRWLRPLSEPLVPRRTALSEEFTPPFVSVSVEWVQALSLPITARRLPEYPAFSFSYFVADAGEVVTPDKWYRPFTDPIRLRFPTSAPLAFVGATPFAESVSVDRWLRPLSEPVRLRLKASEGQFSYGYFVTPEVVTMDKWFQPASTPKRIPRTAYFPTLSYSYTIIVAPPPSTAVYMRGFIVNVGKLTEEP